MKSGLFCAARLLLLLWAAGGCASCVLPMTLHYYVPSADGAAVRSTSCSGDPPYMAVLSGDYYPRISLLVSLVQSGLTGIHDPTLSLIVDPYRVAHITLDPTLIRVEVGGRSVQPKSVRYHLGKYATAPALAAHGVIDVDTDYLIIDLPLGIGGAVDVVTHLPAITVGGQVSQFPDVSFKLEKHTRLIMIAGNC